MTKLVGLGYKARQGKSYLADAMKAKGGNKVKLYAFAQELKEYCRDHHEELYAMYPEVSKNQKDDPIYGFTGMLQHFGTNVMRAKDPDHWVKTLDKRIKAEAPEVALITDVRFPNEAKYVQDSGGALIRIRRFKADGTQYLDPNRDANHPSEIALDDFTEWDFLLDCQDGALTQLQEAGGILMDAIITSEPITNVAGDSGPDSNASVPDSTGFSD